MYDEWLTGRKLEAIELSKFSFVPSSAKNLPAAIGIYSPTNVQRGASATLAQHAGQSVTMHGKPSRVGMMSFIAVARNSTVLSRRRRRWLPPG